MSARGQSITWGMHIGKSPQDARGHWLQRIGQWIAGRSETHKEALRMTLYRVWDSRREQFRPSHAESALELAAERGGQAWLTTTYSAALYAWGRQSASCLHGSSDQGCCKPPCS